MTIKEMKKILINIRIYCAKQYIEEENRGFKYVGFRYADRNLNIGDFCERSRHNTEREDEREFPEYESEEFEDCEVLNGTSAWDITDPYGFDIEDAEENEKKIEMFFRRCDDDDPAKEHNMAEHCYIIIGSEENTPSDADDYEIVIQNARVYQKLW